MNRGRTSILALAAFAVSSSGALAATPEGVIERARAVEREQLIGLGESAHEVAIAGEVQSGGATHQIQATYELRYGSGHLLAANFVRGSVDGRAADEDELRRHIGSKRKKGGGVDGLAQVLTPLTAPEVDVVASGPAPDGSWTLRCRPRHPGKVAAITLRLDGGSARKRSAALTFRGAAARFADRAGVQVTFDEDGGMQGFVASLHLSFFVERSLELSGHRLAPTMFGPAAPPHAAASAPATGSASPALPSVHAPSGPTPHR